MKAFDEIWTFSSISTVLMERVVWMKTAQELTSFNLKCFSPHVSDLLPFHIIIFLRGQISRALKTV
jgi:hypothetical protein